MILFDLCDDFSFVSIIFKLNEKSLVLICIFDELLLLL